MVRVAEDADVGVQLLESMLCMLYISNEPFENDVGRILLGWFQFTYRRIKSEGGLDFLVYNDVHLDSTLGSRLKHGIKTILLVARRRPAKVQLRAQPPIENVDALLGPYWNKCQQRCI